MCCMVNYLHAHVGLCFRAAWVYSSFLHQSFGFFFTCCRPPAYILAGSVSPMVECSGWTHLRFMVQISKDVCVKDTEFDWKCPGTIKKEMSQHPLRCFHDSCLLTCRLFTEPLTSTASRHYCSPAMNGYFHLRSSLVALNDPCVSLCVLACWRHN